MDGTQKILRTIMNGQSSMKSELLGKMTKLEKKVDDGFEKVNPHKSCRKNDIVQLTRGGLVFWRHLLAPSDLFCYYNIMKSQGNANDNYSKK